jgi:putative intracellular protease/amidase
VNVVVSISNANCASCHGPAIFANILDDSGKPIVEGKKITGFTTQAEHEMGIMDGLRAWNEPMIDEHAKTLGANCKSTMIASIIYKIS